MLRSSFAIALFLGTAALAQTGTGAPPDAPAAAAPAPQQTPAAAPAPQQKPSAPAAAAPAPQQKPTTPAAAAPAPQPKPTAPAAAAPAIQQKPAVAPPLQQRPAAAPAPQAAAASAPAGGPPSPARAPHAPATDEDIVLARAKLAFGSLLLGDPRPLVEQATFPFMLEDRKINTADELYEELLRQLRHKRTDLLTLYGIEILSPADMEKKYGKAPARLSGFPVHGRGKVFIAVANLSGHGAVAAYQQVGTEWRMAGYHD